MMVYGPGQWDRTKLLPYVTSSLVAGTSPEVGSGTREMDWVYVDDVVEGFLTVAGSPNVEGRMIDLGTGTLTSIRAIVEAVADVVGSSVPIRFGAIQDRPFEQPRAARVEETRRLTGWVARTSLREGLGRTVDWHRQKCSSAKPV
jgi:nucleoside-diphosphate-sugar epimerase